MNKFTVIAVLLATSCSGAFAATQACPAVSKIKQTPTDTGFTYQAKAENGASWNGENPRADKDDLKKIKFKESYILNDKKIVACDYTGPDNAQGMRMVLDLKKPVKSVGKHWKEEKQSDGTVLPRCAAKSPSECEFK